MIVEILLAMLFIMCLPIIFQLIGLLFAFAVFVVCAIAYTIGIAIVCGQQCYHALRGAHK